MHRDAPPGVAGGRQDLGTAAEVEHVAVAELPIHRHRRCRVRQADRNTLMDRHFPVLEYRRWQCGTRPDRRRVTGARIDRRAGRLVQFGGRAAVIDVTVGQHDPVDARHSRKDFSAGSWRAGVDQRDGIVVVPGIQLPAVDPQHGQVRRDRHHVHAPTLDCERMRRKRIS